MTYVPPTSGESYARIYAGETPTTRAEMGKSDFIQLLVTQLKNQDPTRPMEDKEFIAQLAQFNSLEQMQALNSTMFDLMVLQQFGEAASLIGKTVTAHPPGEEAPISGKVSGIDIVQGEILLRIDGQQVSLRDLLQVSEGS